MMADLIILTKKAAKIAGGEKKRSRSPCTGKRRFLSVVRQSLGQTHVFSQAADAFFTIQAIHTALMRAKAARTQQIIA
jgi:hypothetical protein